MSKVEYILDYSEVDTAVAEKLSGLCIDHYHPITGEIAVPNKPVDVRYYDPDIDFTEEEHPVIVIYRISEMPDTTRWSIDPVVDNLVTATDPESGKETLESVDIRESPEPWNIYYTVRLIAKFQQDSITLSRFYHQKFPRLSYVTVKGVKYDTSHVSSNLFGAGYKTFGVEKSGKREFIQEYMIKVEINLDIHSPITTKTAKTFEVKTTVR